METVMTNEEMISLIKVLEDIPKMNDKLSAKTYYALSKNRKKLIPMREAFMEAREQIIDKHDVRGKRRGEDPEVDKKIDAFTEDMQSILNEKVTCEVHGVNLEEVENSNISIKGVESGHLFFDYVVIE